MSDVLVALLPPNVIDPVPVTSNYSLHPGCHSINYRLASDMFCKKYCYWNN